MKWRLKNSIILIISILFSISFLVAESYDSMNTWQLITKSILISALKFIILMGISVIILTVLFQFFDIVRNKKEQNGNKIERLIFEKHPQVVTIILMIVCWLPNYILYFPGVLTYDAIRQYEEFFQHTLTNHHPVVTTLLESIFIKFGRSIGNQEIGIAIYLLITLILTATAISLGFVWMKRRNINFLFRWMMLAFFMLFPTWSSYARTVVKDALFYPVFFAFVLFFFDYILNDDKELNTKYRVKLIIISFCLVLVRHNGWYVVIGTFFFMILWNKRFRKEATILFVGFLFLFKIYNSFLLPACGVEPGGKEEMLSIPFQQTARYIKYHKKEITNEEKETINKVLNYNTIGKVYNPNLSDPVKGTYTGKDQYLSEYFRVWFLQLKKHPKTYIQATLNGTYGYIGYKKEIKYPIGYFNQPDYNSIYQIKYKIHWMKDLNQVREGYYQILSSAFERFPLKLLSQPMMYTWLFVVLFGYSMLYADIRKYWIVFIPILVLFALCLASPVNGDARYMLPISSTSLLYVAFILQGKEA